MGAAGEEFDNNNNTLNMNYFHLLIIKRIK